MSLDILKQFSQSSDGVFAVDMAHCIVAWNKGAERILGYQAHEVIGKRCCDVIAGVSEGQTYACSPDCAVIARATHGQAHGSHTILSSFKNGEAKWICMTQFLLAGANPELNILVHIFHDTTEQVKAKEIVRHLSELLSTARQIPDYSLLPGSEIENIVADLSPRERQVLQLLAQGTGTRAIAEILVVSSTTVRNHVQSILSKLNVHTRLEAVAIASRQGLFGTLSRN